MSGFLFQIVAIIAIFYFVLIRPQQKERRRLEAMLLALKKGDDVVTTGGIIAEVIHIQYQPQAATAKEAESPGPVPTMADRITIRSGDSKLIVERGKIARVAPKTA
jgi:preprotein translocase subunit YajC